MNKSNPWSWLRLRGTEWLDRLQESLLFERKARSGPVRALKLRELEPQILLSATPALLLSTEASVASSGNADLAGWTDGTVLEVADPNLELESGSTDTNGTLSALTDFEPFGSDGTVDTNALHYVSREMTLGIGDDAINLEVGDLLFSTQQNETLTSLNSVTVGDYEVVVFRPISLNDYSQGTFTPLLSNLNGLFGIGEIRSITLVEQATTVGDVTLDAGDFLFSQSGSSEQNDVYWFDTTDVGEGSTAGTVVKLIEGDELGIQATIYGLELIENTVTIGSVTLDSGQLLLSIDANDSVGDNGLSVNEHDVFALTVTTTTPQSGAGTAAATAERVFEGSDLKLDSNQETLDAFTLALDSINDSPVNSVPGIQTTDINTDLTFNLANGNLISVSDSDIGTNDLEVTLGVANGTLTLSGTTNLTFTAGDGADDANMTFHGAISAVNAALNGLVYTPATSFNGMDTIVLSSNDQGATGIGGVRSDTDSIDVQIGGVTFQQGVNGYTGTVDTELHSAIPTTQLSAEDTIRVDQLDFEGFSFGEAQGLIRFDDLVGSGSGQIPVGSTIVDANLTVYVLERSKSPTPFSQFATSVIDFSSEWDPNDTGAVETLGPSDTFAYGDLSTAWAPLPENGTLEYITVGYDTPVYAEGVVIRETWGNGFVYQVDVIDMSDQLHTVWTGVDPSLPGSPVDFSVVFEKTDFLVKGVRVYTDTDHNQNTREEIDSIQLVGSTTANATVSMHRVIENWDAASTWNSMSNGLSRDDVEVSSVQDSQTTITDQLGFVSFHNLASTVQDWADGESNLGWGLFIDSDDGWEIASSDHANTSWRPCLTITYASPVAPVVDLNGADPGSDHAGSFTEGGSPVAIAKFDATLTNVDDSFVDSMTVEITNLQDGAFEVLSFDTTGTSISGVYSNGLLTLNNRDSVANYLQVLQTISYANLDEDPNAGVRTIEVKAVDDDGISNTATSSIDVSSINDAPFNNVPPQQSITEDTSLTFDAASSNAITVGDVDAGSSPIQIRLTVSNGLLTLGDSSEVTITEGTGTSDSAVTMLGTIADINTALEGLHYSPESNYNGFDTLTITTNDRGFSGSGGARETISAVDIEVVAVNDRPTSSGISDVFVTEDAPSYQINLQSAFADTEDADSQLTYSVFDNSNSVLVGTSIDPVTGILTLSFAPDEFGSADVTVRATDTGGLAVDTTFTVNVDPVNDRPTTSGIADLNVDEDADDSTIDLYAAFADIEDADSQLTYSVVGNTDSALVGTSIDPITGQLTLNYAPNGFGSADVTVRATDTGGLAVDTTFNVNVAPDNDQPTTSGIADVDVIEDAADTTIDLNAAFEDIEDSDNQLIYLVSSNSNPALVGTSIDPLSGELSLAYAADVNGVADITIRATDTGGLTVETQFRVTVAPVNDRPTTSGLGAVNVAEDSVPTIVDLRSAFSDLEDSDDQLVYEVFGNTGSSLLSTSIDPASDNLSLMYAADANGSSDLIVRATDTSGEYVEAPFTVTVTPVNDRPVATSESYQLNQGDSVAVSGADGVLRNDADVDGDPVLATLVSGPTNGTITFTADGSFVYSPEAAFFGTDSFTYIAGDGTLSSEPTTVTLKVEQLPAPPPPAPPELPEEREDDEAYDSVPFELIQTPAIPPAELMEGRLMERGRLSSTNAQEEVGSGSNQFVSMELAATKSKYASFIIISPELVNEEVSAKEEQSSELTEEETGSNGILDMAGLWKQIEQIEEQFEQELADSQTGLVVGTASAVGATFSVGYVYWALRGGSLLAGLASSVPAWRLMDPLPVLSTSVASSEQRQDDQPDSLEDLIKQRLNSQNQATSSSAGNA